ncbi:hypothetical protein N1031_17490 [Herbiconiux moechotypicola]|uniref:Uncharacterized protein n=1 Tax=Herbiconiux moechotypicola TaxID=637393 RepID=A0ABN3E2V4_9MICO|nr:hypothetical protein [Herbiconiux moechotypicola]MCS5731557.1 hypothetical protein [Herbiconiux moechotypicola]
MLDTPPLPAREPRQHPSRRTVVTAAAWSVPVVALAVATPLAAASTDPTSLADLAVGFSFVPDSGVSAKAGGLEVRVYDQNAIGAWTGSFVLTLTLVPDDTVLVINQGVTNPAPEPTVVGTWTFVGYTAPLTNGSIGMQFSWSGTIPAGDFAVLTLDPAGTASGFVSFIDQPGAPNPFSTSRTAEIGAVVGTDTVSGNSVTQPLTYFW